MYIQAVVQLLQWTGKVVVYP